MASLKEQTRHSNNISDTIALTNKTTGLISFPLRNLLTTMLPTPQPVFRLSLPIRAITQYSTFIPNGMLLHSAHESSQPISTNSTSTLQNPSSSLKSGIKSLPISEEFRHLTSNQAIGFSLSPRTSRPPARLVNLPNHISVHLKLLTISERTPFVSVFLTNSASFIPSSMSCKSSPP